MKLDDMTIDPPGPPYTYFGVAESMLPGVVILAHAPATSPLALCLVSAHVLECALKAYLSKDGSDASVKHPSVRHNLAALWEMAHSQGLAVPMTPPLWVAQLSQIHNSPYYLRYSTGVHGVVSPSAALMAEGLPDLVAKVGAALR